MVYGSDLFITNAIYIIRINNFLCFHPSFFMAFHQMLLYGSNLGQSLSLLITSLGYFPFIGFPFVHHFPLGFMLRGRGRGINYKTFNY